MNTRFFENITAAYNQSIPMKPDVIGESESITMKPENMIDMLEKIAMKAKEKEADIKKAAKDCKDE